MVGFDIEGVRRRRHDEFARSVEQLLAEDEAVRVAVLVDRTGSTTLRGLLWDVLFRFGAGRRRYFSLVLTDRRLLLIENRGEKQPDSIAREWATLDVIEAVDRGRFWVQIEQTRYWYMPEWQAEINQLWSATRGEV